MLSRPSVTVGIDRHSHLCVLDTKSGEFLEKGRLQTTPRALEKRFAGRERMRAVIEAGTHSPWASRLLERCGHEVLVANASLRGLIPRRRATGGRRRARRRGTGRRGRSLALRTSRRP